MHGGRELRPGELRALAVQRLPRRSGRVERRQPAVQAAVERAHHDEADHGDGQESGRPRHGVVDPRRDARMAGRHRSHDRGRQRRHGDGHPRGHDNHGREVGRPVAPADVRQREQDEPGGRDDRADGQRALRPVARDQTTRPAREREHDGGEGEQGGTGRRRGVALDLLEVEREEVQGAAQRPVQEQREQVRPAESARAEQAQLQHWRPAAGFDGDEEAQRDRAGRQAGHHQRMAQAQRAGLDEPKDDPSQS